MYIVLIKQSIFFQNSLFLSLSNLLYLHSTNLPSMLGPYRPPASSHPASSLQSDTTVAPPSPIPHTDTTVVHSSNVDTSPI